MTCVKCGKEFNPDESTGVIEGISLCQMDWEAECSKSWWEMVKDLEPTGYPDEYVRLPKLSTVLFEKL